MLTNADTEGLGERTTVWILAAAAAAAGLMSAVNGGRLMIRVGRKQKDLSPDLLAVLVVVVTVVVLLLIGTGCCGRGAVVIV